MITTLRGNIDCFSVVHQIKLLRFAGDMGKHFLHLSLDIWTSFIDT